jgi:RNA polymerase sigma-B factor
MDAATGTPEPPAPHEARTEERDLLARYVALPADDPARAGIREALVVLYQPMVRSLAQRYASRGEPLDDLVQAGSIGLLKAIDRYDPSRGDSLAGLLVPTVLGEIRRHFRDHTWSIRVPRGISELAVRVRAATPELEQRLGRSPTVAELAEHLGVDDDAVLEALEAGGAYRADSLDQPWGEGDALSLDPGSDDDALARLLDREALRPALAELTDRERALLNLRFVEQRTQSEIAQELGVDQSQVSRLLARTLLDLRQRLDPDAAH